MTKAQADQLTASLREQSKAIKVVKLQYSRLQVNHQSLLNEYAKVKLELKRTNSYNDSVMNYLGDNMALLYKVRKESDVYFVNLRHYIIDVFPRGTIVLNPPSILKRKEYEQHLKLMPEWRYINIANELDPDRRYLVDYVRLFPERFRDYELMEYNLRPTTYIKQ